MEVTTQCPEKEYPYLAVFVGSGGELSAAAVPHIKSEEILVISLVPVDKSDNQVYVQPLLGGKKGYVTYHEDEYAPLPKGYVAKIIQ